MSEPTPAHGPRRLNTSLIAIAAIVLFVSLFFVCLIGTAGVVAIQQRVITAPNMSVRLGGLELAAPCPPQGFICDKSTPFFAVWVGRDRPDGSTNYKEIFFMYLSKLRKP
jgi:hypothetical protein